MMDYFVSTRIPPIDNYLSRVARNHARILNHRELIEKKIRIGQHIGLIQNNSFSNELIDNNLNILSDLQEGLIDTNTAISKIAHTSSRFAGACSLTEKEIYDNLGLATVAGHIELHPTDLCDHRCIGCYYSEKGSDVMPFAYVEPILRTYRPRSIVLVGGGEPTMYRDGQYRFSDLVSKIKEVDPKIQIGLVTKGTMIPDGDWQKHVDWVRLSIDSASKTTFKEAKGRDAFEEVIENFLKYLKGPIPHVGLGYLVWSHNIHETYELPLLIYSILKNVSPDLIYKINIQYRPMRPAVDHPEKIKKNQVSDTMICSRSQVVSAVRNFEEMMARDADLNMFIQNHTNWHKVTEGNGVRTGKRFAHCYYTLAYKMFRPTGEIYSCFSRVSDPDYLLGNYMHNGTNELIKVNLLSYLLYQKRRSHCHENYCRLSWLNNIAEQGLNDLIPMPEGDTARSFFF